MLKNQRIKTVLKLVFSLTLILAILPFHLLSCSSKDNGVPAPTNTAKYISKNFEISKAVFLGDSNTAHLATYGLISNEQILTGSEYYLTLEPDVCNKYVVCRKNGKEMTPAEAVKILSPDFLIITLGTDGAISLDKAGFELSYKGLIESIEGASPHTEIILQSIFPVRNGSHGIRFDDVKHANQKFKAANKWISEIAAEYGLTYIDTFSVLSDEAGELKAEYNTDHLDGYHLNEAGLRAMLNYICESVGDEK